MQSASMRLCFKSKSPISTIEEFNKSSPRVTLSLAVLLNENRMTQLQILLKSKNELRHLLLSNLEKVCLNYLMLQDTGTVGL